VKREPPTRRREALDALLARHWPAGEVRRGVSRGAQNLARYSRSCKSPKSANSLQKAKRWSSGKRKTSSSSSYTNSVWPMILKYVSMRYRASANRAASDGSGRCGTPLAVLLMEGYCPLVAVSSAEQSA
jgi:hypothetical protein